MSLVALVLGYALYVVTVYVLSVYIFTCYVGSKDNEEASCVSILHKSHDVACVSAQFTVDDLYVATRLREVNELETFYT